MRGYILICLWAAACSADKLGYNYQPVAHADEGLSFVPGNGLLPALDAAQPQALPQSLPQSLPLALPQSLPQHGEAELSLPIEPPVIAASAAPSGLLPQAAPLIEEFQKEFYSYAAPEEQFDEPINNQQIADSLKKSLRILFIRTPENRGFEQAALQLAKQSAQQETAIYVLSKQADVTNLAKQLNALKSTSTNKPEVHFVKYRTPQDAANAQLAIQNQYNQLPGASRISNEGSAPVLNFASQTAPLAAPLPIQSASAARLASSTEQLGSGTGLDYLPPALRRFRVK